MAGMSIGIVAPNVGCSPSVEITKLSELIRAENPAAASAAAAEALSSVVGFEGVGSVGSSFVGVSSLELVSSCRALRRLMRVSLRTAIMACSFWWGVRTFESARFWRVFARMRWERHRRKV